MADAKPGSRRTNKPVKPPTIDLKAEEVKATSATTPPDAAGAAADAGAEKDTPARAAGAATKTAGDAAFGKAASDGPAAGSRKSSSTPPPKGPESKPAASAANLMSYARYLGAGVTGAVAALAVNFIAGQFVAEPRAPASIPPELAARIDALETHRADTTVELARISEKLAQPAPAPVDVDAALAPLRSELGASKDALARLQGETADLKTRLEAIAASGVNGAPAEAIAGFEAAIKALQTDVAALKDAQAAGVSGQWDETRIAALEAALAGLKGYAEQTRSLAGEAGAGLSALKGQVAGLAERLAAAGGAAGGDASAAAATALALADLRDAISRGAPFATELAALRALAGDIAVLSRLDPLADAGVATQRQLSGRFETILRDVLAAAHKRDDAGIVAQLVDGVRGIVTIRPVGELAGDSPEAVVARIETSLADGDYAGALAAWNALPAAARVAGGDWGNMLSRKAEADAIVSQVGRDIVASLKGAS